MSFFRAFLVSAFRRYWLGELVGGLGSQVLEVSIVWYLASRGGAREVGWFLFWSQLPVALGGPIGGELLRRMGARAGMVLELGVRALGFGAFGLCLLRGFGAAWVYDAVGAGTALLGLVPAAGGPSLWPALVSSGELAGAAQGEQIGWNAAALVGPVLAGGLLAARVPLGWIALGGAALFLAAAVNLGTLDLVQGDETQNAAGQGAALAWRQALLAIAGSEALWLPTALFWLLNLVNAAIGTFLPLIVRDAWHAGAASYGLWVAASAAGGLIGGLTLAGSGEPCLGRVLRWELGASALTLLLVPGLRWPILAIAGTALPSWIGAATATWVLRLRLAATDEPERPLVFAYIRTALWTASPLGSLLAGLLWRRAWGPALVAGGAGLMVLGCLGGLLALRGLRRRSGTAGWTAQGRRLPGIEIPATRNYGGAS